MSRTLTKTNPKGEDILASDNCIHYGNGAFALNFQEGQIPLFGVRNGAFDEEILSVLIDRMEHLGLTAVHAKLTEAFALLVPNPWQPPDEPDPAE